MGRLLRKEWPLLTTISWKSANRWKKAGKEANGIYIRGERDKKNARSCIMYLRCTYAEGTYHVSSGLKFYP